MTGSGSFLKNAGTMIGVACIFIVNAVFAQNNLDIYYQYCEAKPDNDCFSPVNGAVDTVGRDVSELGGDYRFCLKIDSVNSGVAPIRVILVLDKSGSMCNNYDECCTEGDGSGNCAKNDPNNMRVEAANAFVDSLKALSPASQIGVITYVGSSTVMVNPTSLENADDVTDIHTAINTASCSLEDDSRGALTKKAATKATNLGDALIKAMVEADRDFDKIPSYMKRHIILLTDGAWDDVGSNPPMEIINDYRTEHAATVRELPQIHGVFISDSLTHVTHGYPAQGCASRGATVELSNLKTAADSSGGQFFGGTTPQTIVANFRQLLKSMVKVEAQKLIAITVTNNINGVTVSGDIDSVASPDPMQAHYIATVNKFPIDFGLNTLTVKQVIRKTEASVPETTTSVVSIFRTKQWTTKINEEEYKIYCKKDTTTININVSPGVRYINETFNVVSNIVLKDKFTLDTIQARLYTANADEQDKYTIGLFHLDDTLLNSVDKKPAVGNDALKYSSTDVLFGSHVLTDGTFTTSIGMLSGDFAFEAWIKPSGATVRQDIFSTGAFSCGITADRYMYFKFDDKETRSVISVDANSWSHIAVSRYNGIVGLFINGIDASVPMAFDNTVSGALDISVPQNGLLDEVRISNVNRLRMEKEELLRFDIATFANPVWTLYNETSQQPSLTIDPSKWNNGNIQFQFTCAVTGRVILNFQHRGTLQETQWSKNGNPVLITEVLDLQGPYVTRGVFTRGEINSDYDTFDVFFSEPIRCDSLKKPSDLSATFEIFDSNSVKKNTVFNGAKFIDNTCQENSLITEVRMLVKPMYNGIFPGKDSVRLIGISIDTDGNHPDTTKRGPIEFGKGNQFILRPIVNPEKDKPMTLSDPYMIRLGIPEEKRNSKLLLLQTRDRLEPISIDGGEPDYSEKAVIYDAVGNIVCENAPIRQSDSDVLLYYIVWNGMNKNSRKVSSGAYLFRATIRYANNPGKGVPIKTKFNLDWGTKDKF